MPRSDRLKKPDPPLSPAALPPPEESFCVDEVTLKRPKRGTILVVDDSELVRMIASERLADDGWEVEQAGGGEAALEIASRVELEAVVCDLHMPGMTGFEVLRRLRKIDPTLPVIVLSDDQDLSSVLLAVHQGAFDYVLKGEDIRPLLTAVDRAASHARIVRENLRLTQELQVANKTLEQRLVELHLEQDRSERLLLNVLPKVIADRLKNGMESIADGHHDVTVLFADIVDFTRLASDKSPSVAVTLLNSIFSSFDRLADQHGLEKIKTIGDAYMAAAGIPLPRPDHAEAAAEMALEMLQVIKKGDLGLEGPLRLRIGLHTGPVVAGVIGEKKFIYDLWGDTVNIASRMESQGLPDCIQMTSATRERLGVRYLIEERGPIEVKGKGRMEVFLLRGKS